MADLDGLLKVLGSVQGGHVQGLLMLLAHAFLHDLVQVILLVGSAGAPLLLQDQLRMT